MRCSSQTARSDAARLSENGELARKLRTVSDNEPVRRWFLRRRLDSASGKFDRWLNKRRQAGPGADPSQHFQKSDMSIWLSFDEAAANEVTAVLFRNHAGSGGR
jgi:hypothetical protein